jgi:hypothetical protein
MCYNRLTKVAHRRAHIIMPEELLGQIDRLVGRRGRSRFLVSAATNELRRQRQIAALNRAAGSWKDEDHPELQGGAEKWVDRLRRQSDKRLAWGGRR